MKNLEIAKVEQYYNIAFKQLSSLIDEKFLALIEFEECVKKLAE